jgi:hypothetical protein
MSGVGRVRECMHVRARVWEGAGTVHDDLGRLLLGDEGLNGRTQVPLPCTHYRRED